MFSRTFHLQWYFWRLEIRYLCSPFSLLLTPPRISTLTQDSPRSVPWLGGCKNVAALTAMSDKTILDRTNSSALIRQQIGHATADVTGPVHRRDSQTAEVSCTLHALLLQEENVVTYTRCLTRNSHENQWKLLIRLSLRRFRLETSMCWKERSVAEERMGFGLQLCNP